MQSTNTSQEGAVGYQAAPAPQPAPRSGQASDPNKRLQETQSQVNEVVVIMRDNMERVLQRDEKLSELDSRADALQDVSQQFSTTTTRLKRKYWWKNLKMWLILGGVTVVIIIIIIVAIVTSVQK